jgi:hypothetical protein
MRLPTDATLLIGSDAEPALEQAWREEGLPVLQVADLGRLEAELEAIGTATVVVCGAGAVEMARLAARLGFRTFLVSEDAAPEGAQRASLAQTLEAARAARARERWKAARGSAG